jgi:HK97 family phage portal protein
VRALPVLRSILQRATEERTIFAQDFWGAWAKGEVDSPAGGYSTMAGLSVSRESALGVPALWACVNLIADSIATMPAYAYEGIEPAKTRLSAQPSWLKNANTEQTFLDCVHQQLVSLLTDGSAYVYTPRDRFGEVTELWLVDARMVIPRREPDGRGGLELVYYVSSQPSIGSPYAPTPPDNFRNRIRLTQLEMFQVRALTMPGWLKGVSPIDAARNMIASAIAGQELGTRFFGQGMNSPGVIEVPEDLTPEQTSDLKQDFRDFNTGLRNMHVPPILTGGASWKTTMISPEQAQFLESRKFSVTEIARWYRVPPHMVGDIENSTSWGAGIEQQGIAFVTNTLRPWIERLEAVYSRYLLLFEPAAFIRFDTNQLLRGDMAARAVRNASAIGWGYMSPNEAREEEGWAPRPGGDDFLEPLNMQLSGGDKPRASFKGAAPDPSTAIRPVPETGTSNKSGGK